MDKLPKDVAIIGAGLAGTLLALAFQQISVPCRIYESRNADASEISSGVVLTPNGLKVLDHLGVFDRITSRCWKAEYRTYKNDKDETTKKVSIANEEVYGYKNHRLYRRVLLDELKLMLEELRVPISYNARFEGVVNDDLSSDMVSFQVNGKVHQCDLLVGADGIYSSVRKYISPNTVPEYTGTMGVLSHIYTDSVNWPYKDYEKQVTIQGKPGAMFTMPEVPDASEIMVGKQAKYPDQSREEWEAMSRDKDRLCEFYRQGYEEWTSTGRSIIDAVCANKETLYLWPFLRMPMLPRWFSKSGRVLILGDSAHAIPPSSGQGVNQALEDVYSLTQLLSKAPTSKSRVDVLSFWQDMRQKRVDDVFDWAVNGTNVQRMSEAERQQLLAEAKANGQPQRDADDMSWLYQHGIDQQIEEWIR